MTSEHRMSDKKWLDQWQQSQYDPYHRVVLSLVLFNGLSCSQVETLPTAVIDYEFLWLTTSDGDTYPLVSHTAEALKSLYHVSSVLDVERLQDVIDIYRPLEAESHRLLSGAVWITDDSLQLALETTGSRDIPILPLRFTFPFSIVGRLQPGETTDTAIQARQILQTAADWLAEQLFTTNLTLWQRLSGLLRQGSIIFLIASTGVNGLNLLHNVLMGRLLSPGDYGQLTFIITLQLLIGLIPIVLQTVMARFTARYQANDDLSRFMLMRQWLGRIGWRIGWILAAFLAFLSPLFVNLFQLDGVNLLIPVIVTIPFFVRMGVDRGILQGAGRYVWLSGAYIVEAVIRLGVGVVLGYVLLQFGRGLEGAVWGVAQSMIATWFISWLAIQHLESRRVADELPQDGDARREWIQLGWMTTNVLIGQALITNSDFLLVKNFFSPEEAGLYAAISVLGRIVYFGALPLTIIIVPLVARRQALAQSTRPILLLLVSGGAVICGGLVIIAGLFAPSIMRLFYGEVYMTAAPLLASYALVASLYTLANLVITYQIALGIGGETWMPLLAGVAQIVGVMLFHETLTQVIGVQIVLMCVLLVAVLWRVMRVAPHPPAQLEAVAGGVPV